MKAGYRTTEFWTTLLTHFISIAVLFSANLNTDKLSALVPVAALVLSAASQAFYSRSRGVVKSAHSLTTAITPPVVPSPVVVP